MTAPLPENVRQAGYDALEELAARMSRGATSLLKQAMRLRLDDPKSQREALCQLRRYQNFKMPGFEQVATARFHGPVPPPPTPCESTIRAAAPAPPKAEGRYR